MSQRKGQIRTHTEIERVADLSEILPVSEGDQETDTSPRKGIEIGTAPRTGLTSGQETTVRKTRKSLRGPDLEGLDLRNDPLGEAGPGRSLQGEAGLGIGSQAGGSVPGPREGSPEGDLALDLEGGRALLPRYLLTVPLLYDPDLGLIEVQFYSRPLSSLVLLCMLQGCAVHSTCDCNLNYVDIQELQSPARDHL